MYLSASAVAVSTWGAISSARPFFTFIKLYFITTILTVHTARTLRVFEILKPRRALSTHARASNSQADADDCLLQAGWASVESVLKLLQYSECDSINVTVSAGYKVAPLLRRVLRASLQRDQGVEGADQSRPYANAGLVQCFRLRLSSICGRGNWKCIGIAIFTAQKYHRYLIDNSFHKYWR